MEAKFKVGDKVQVLDGKFSVNYTGDVGIIKEIDLNDKTARVEVEGRPPAGNWNYIEDLELVKSNKSKGTKVYVLMFV